MTAPATGDAARAGPGAAGPAVSGPNTAPGASAGPALSRVGAASVLVALALLVLAPVLRRYGVGTSTPYLVAGLLLGLPHGAVDHLVPAWRSLRARPLPVRMAVPLGYGAVAGAALLAFRAAPVPALLVFLGLSVIHFGAADEAFHAERDGRPIRYPAAGVLARGGPPVVVPLLLWPETVDPLLAAVAPGVPALLTVEIRLLAAACLLAAVAATALRALRRGRAAEAVEPILLLLLFAAVPPALAVGSYFATWHSARHVARLLHDDPANRPDLAAGRLGPPARRFARRAAPPTLAAVAVLAALVGGSTGPVDPLPATVAVLAALTVPHAALVAWTDRRAAPPPHPGR